MAAAECPCEFHGTLHPPGSVVKEDCNTWFVSLPGVGVAMVVVAEASPQAAHPESRTLSRGTLTQVPVTGGCIRPIPSGALQYGS